MGGGHGQVVDIDLAPRALELRQFIGRQPPDDDAVLDSRQCNEIRAGQQLPEIGRVGLCAGVRVGVVERRSEEHTSELQSLMRISYAVFCWKKKKETEEKRTTSTQDTK